MLGRIEGLVEYESMSSETRQSTLNPRLKSREMRRSSSSNSYYRLNRATEAEIVPPNQKMVAQSRVFFERKLEFTPDNANTVNSIVYILLVSIGCHALLAFTFINPYIAMCILGVAYSMLARAPWPMVALVIPEYQLGTAYGTAADALEREKLLASGSVSDITPQDLLQLRSYFHDSVR
ncbi:Major facilitator superfamily domain-containing protein 1 [Zootermopsis nevadensis]|uniref:Major facilitator superfamily domain-containing protein 1 n=1 Tax=Zootermopsis nevadensis TaxID=136037 RepID=A0A067R497_ZOONE|nr:Major facilitator superfamily domain-containing protein 1 [Zootermopsis nevadensis]